MQYQRTGLLNSDRKDAAEVGRTKKGKVVPPLRVANFERVDLLIQLEKMLLRWIVLRKGKMVPPPRVELGTC
ncbi:MAG: hypothetical protein COB20_13550 [SAR86 cluster bacterium]|uniref:Uncharacterized protein n=1 Tax=SAR86 cluster bacterium TaxID=2030880 RepID=A0A2A4WXQ6_9GAMM|nr:MAG: hypothetical protein COB20_13550 [SAR86 cluster bacterium]